MASMIDRLKRRKCYPVTLPGQGGEKIWVRALTIGEMRAVDSLPAELRAAFALGCAIVTDTGEQDMPRGTVPGKSPGDGSAPETNEEYATRVLSLLSDVPTDNLNTASEAIAKLRDQPPVEELVKN